MSDTLDRSSAPSIPNRNSGHIGQRPSHPTATHSYGWPFLCHSGSCFECTGSGHRFGWSIQSPVGSIGAVSSRIAPDGAISARNLGSNHI